MTTLRSVMLAGLVGLWLVSPIAIARAEEAAKPSGAGKAGNITDSELRAFAKAYVDFHRIQQSYESPLKNAKSLAERDKMQQEGNAKVKAAVEKQGLTIENYNRIFAAVNGDKDLREKTLKLINEERKQAKK